MRFRGVTSTFIVAAAAVLLSAGVLAAGPPVAFDQYSVNSGDITSGASNDDCSGLTVPGAPLATVVCSDVLVDDGMMQRKVSVSNAGPLIDGDYIQFVITDSGTTGDPTADPFSAGRGNLTFTNEDFVKQNNRGGGIASRQTIVDASLNGSLEDRFSTSTEYMFGWAIDVADPWVMVTQDISQVDYSGVDPIEVFSSDALIENNSIPGDWSGNSTLILNQTLDLTEVDQGEGAQGFKFAKSSGAYQDFSRTSLINQLDLLDDGVLNGSAVLLPGGTNGGTPTYNWLSGDELRALWLGQWFEQGSAAGGESFFGLTRYSAVNSSTQFSYPTQLVSFTDTTAVGWADILNVEPLFGMSTGFGAEPVLPMAPVVVAATDDGGVGAPDPIAATISPGSAPASGTTPVDLPLSAYNDWRVTNGVFHGPGGPGTPVPCNGTGTVVCAEPRVNEGGVFQRAVSINGVVYIQTITADTNATGDPNQPDFAANSLAFKSESFVQLGSIEGIAANLHIAQEDLGYVGTPGNTLPTNSGQFAYNTQLKTGWANGGPLDARVAVDQRLLVPESGFPAQVTGMDYDFHLRVGETPLDKVIYFSNAVGTETNSTWGTPSFNLGAPIMFATTKVTGAFQDQSHLAGPDLLPSGDITWDQYDAIQATWVGGAYTTPDPFAATLVGTTSYTNLSTGDRIAYTDLTDSPPDPPLWVDPFATYSDPQYSSAYVPPAF